MHVFWLKVCPRGRNIFVMLLWICWPKLEINFRRWNFTDNKIPIDLFHLTCLVNFEKLNYACRFCGIHLVLIPYYSQCTLTHLLLLSMILLGWWQCVPCTKKLFENGSLNHFHMLLALPRVFYRLGSILREIYFII